MRRQEEDMPSADAGARRRALGGKGIRRLLVAASLIALLGAVAIVSAHFLGPSAVERAQPLTALFRLLESRGFRANPGLAGTLTPGTLVQVHERDGMGRERNLAAPLVVKWGSDCFPGRQPQESLYALPEESGATSDHLAVDGNIVDSETPALSLRDSSVAGYRLRLGRPHLRTFAKGDISGEFSAACVEALDRAVASGEPVGWYRLVIETVVVDSLEYDIEWKKSAGATSQASLAELLRGKLGASLGGPKGSAVSVSSKTDDEGHSVLTAAAQAIVAYRLRPVELGEVSAVMKGRHQ
jgi:hypothetical protein